MDNRNENMLLDEVLFAFHKDVSRPTPDIVANWIEKYPRFAAEIREAAVACAEMLFEELTHHSNGSEERVVRRAESAALNALYNARQHQSGALSASASRTPLARAIENSGVTLQEVARQMGLSCEIISRVGRGSILSLSVPGDFIRMLCRILQCSEAYVQDLLPPAVAFAQSVEGNHGSLNSEHALPKQTFHEAILEDEDIDEVKKAFWLQIP